MAFIQNNKFREIIEASKNGNEKAMKIIQALRNQTPQSDIDNLVSDYYSLNTTNEQKEEIAEQEILPNEIVPEQVEEVPPQGEVIDLTDTLNVEMEDLLDENEIDDINFNDFLKNKNRDGVRSRKNSEYFKAYDLVGRQNYMTTKINDYKKKFNGRLKNIERNFRDVDNSINKYIDNTNLELDDDKNLDMEQVGLAYNAILGNENFMNSFGRSWDEEDTQEIYSILKALIQTYGKQNVLAVLNTLKSDNENYKNFRTNQIDTEVSRYSKSIENLLK